MANLIKIECSKSYATQENAIKAAQKIYGSRADLRFFVHPLEDGRFVPVFIGQNAVTAGVHFNFNVIG